MKLEEVENALKGSWKIKFKGNEFLLIHGAITTPELFERFSPSLAHLMEDGAVIRYDISFGNHEDIEIIEAFE